MIISKYLSLSGYSRIKLNLTSVKLWETSCRQGFTSTIHVKQFDKVSPVAINAQKFSSFPRQTFPIFFRLTSWVSTRTPQLLSTTSSPRYATSSHLSVESLPILTGAKWTLLSTSPLFTSSEWYLWRFPRCLRSTADRMFPVQSTPLSLSSLFLSSPSVPVESNRASALSEVISLRRTRLARSSFRVSLHFFMDPSMLDLCFRPLFLRFCENFSAWTERIATPLLSSFPPFWCWSPSEPSFLESRNTKKNQCLEISLPSSAVLLGLVCGESARLKQRYFFYYHSSLNAYW